jgi:hypothetical protein
MVSFTTSDWMKSHQYQPEKKLGEPHRKTSLFLPRFEPKFTSESAHVLVTDPEINHNYSQPAQILVNPPEINHNYSQPAHVLVTVPASHW